MRKLYRKELEKVKKLYPNDSIYKLFLDLGYFIKIENLPSITVNDDELTYLKNIIQLKLKKKGLYININNLDAYWRSLISLFYEENEIKDLLRLCRSKLFSFTKSLLSRVSLKHYDSLKELKILGINKINAQENLLKILVSLGEQKNNEYKVLVYRFHLLYPSYYVVVYDEGDVLREFNNIYQSLGLLVFNIKASPGGFYIYGGVLSNKKFIDIIFSQTGRILSVQRNLLLNVLNNCLNIYADVKQLAKYILKTCNNVQKLLLLVKSTHL